MKEESWEGRNRKINRRRQDWRNRKIQEEREKRNKNQRKAGGPVKILLGKLPGFSFLESAQ